MPESTCCPSSRPLWHPPRFRWTCVVLILPTWKSFSEVLAGRGGMLLVPKFYSPICQTQISVLHNVTQYVDATTLQDKIIFCRSFPAKHACSISPRFQTGNLQNTTRILLYPGLTGSSLIATDLLIAAKSQPQPHDNLNPKLQKNRLTSWYE